MKKKMGRPKGSVSLVDSHVLNCILDGDTWGELSLIAAYQGGNKSAVVRNAIHQYYLKHVVLNTTNKPE